MFCSPFFVQFLVENCIFFQITSLSIEKGMKLKCSADQILSIKSKFVSFDLLQEAIRSFTSSEIKFYGEA